MSESEHREHESEVGEGGNGKEDEKERENGDGDGRESNVDERRKEVEGKRKGSFGISSVFGNAIKRPFRNRRKRRKDEKEIVKLPAAASSRRKIFGGEGGCYVCFMRPGREESPETPTSDPNSESFSFAMLRTLIEKNDFYCKECNPHI